MNPLKIVKQPEYFYRPGQVLRKLKRSFQRHKPLEEVLLPWGARIRVCPGEHIGSRIWHRGVFDLTVLEAICRLSDPGETAIDIGANNGQMTSLLSYQIGKGGRVHAFEPHPIVFKLLSENVAALQREDGCAEVLLHNLALSDFHGEAFLDGGAMWERNHGLARLVNGEEGVASGQQLRVPVTTLDKTMGPGLRVGFCKLDVEGHELNILRGASTMLLEQRIRDIVFEDLGPYPGPVQQHLLNHGYTLFALLTPLNGPDLSADWANPKFDGNREGADFLATLEPERATERFKARGWRALKR